ncbi:14309_t:CDS:2, partial [Gigaspora margarita]
AVDFYYWKISMGLVLEDIRNENECLATYFRKKMKNEKPNSPKWGSFDRIIKESHKFPELKDTLSLDYFKFSISVAVDTFASKEMQLIKLKIVKDLFTTYGQLISNQFLASTPQVLSTYTKIITSISKSLEQKQKKYQPSEESAQEIV